MNPANYMLNMSVIPGHMRALALRYMNDANCLLNLLFLGDFCSRWRDS